MTLKKIDRKQSYLNILGLMARGDNKLAYEKMVHMCADDVSLFVLADYNQAVKRFAPPGMQVDKRALEKLLNDELAEIEALGAEDGAVAIGEFFGAQIQVQITRNEDDFFESHHGVVTLGPEGKA